MISFLCVIRDDISDIEPEIYTMHIRFVYVGILKSSANS
jgi:hypothetical protein